MTADGRGSAYLSKRRLGTLELAKGLHASQPLGMASDAHSCHHMRSGHIVRVFTDWGWNQKATGGKQLYTPLLGRGGVLWVSASLPLNRDNRGKPEG